MSPWLWKFGLHSEKTETLPNAITVRERQRYTEGKKVKDQIVIDSIKIPQIRLVMGNKIDNNLNKRIHTQWTNLCTNRQGTKDNHPVCKYVAGKENDNSF